MRLEKAAAVEEGSQPSDSGNWLVGLFSKSVKFVRAILSVGGAVAKSETDALIFGVGVLLAVPASMFSWERWNWESSSAAAAHMVACAIPGMLLVLVKRLVASRLEGRTTTQGARKTRPNANAKTLKAELQKQIQITAWLEEARKQETLLLEIYQLRAERLKLAQTDQSLHEDALRTNDQQLVRSTADLPALLLDTLQDQPRRLLKSPDKDGTGYGSDK